MEIPLITFLIQGIPEVIGATALCFVLAGAGLRWRWILTVGLLQAATVYILRLLPLPFGLHSIIIVLLYVPYLRVIAAVPPLRALFAAFLAMALLALFEFVSFNVLMQATGLSYEKIMVDPLLRARMGLPQVFLLFATAFIIDFLGRKRNNASAVIRR